ncbi:trichohyalin-like [Tachysurus ichikawai]
MAKQKIPEMATMQEMTKELQVSESKKEAGEKEGLEIANKKLKRLSIPWFQMLIEQQRTKEHQPKTYNGIFL